MIGLLSVSIFKILSACKQILEHENGFACTFLIGLFEYTIVCQMYLIAQFGESIFLMRKAAVPSMIFIDHWSVVVTCN